MADAKILSKDLTKQVEQIYKNAIKTAIKTDVAPVVRNKLIEHINSDILKQNYKGKGNHIRSGFADVSNNVIEYGDDYDFKVKNITKPVSVFNTEITDYSSNPTIFGYWIEYGRVPVLWDNGDSSYVTPNPPFNTILKDRNGEYIKRNIPEKAFPPRPFVANTKKELSEHPNILNDALVKGLKRQGIKFK